MKVKETKEEIRYTQPLSVDLANKVDNDAQAQNRSRNQQVVWILTQHYKRQEILNQEKELAVNGAL